MAEATGKLLTCDRCGATCFLKCTGDGVTDGGYTRWNKFEDRPKGWQYHSDSDIGQLCPKCNAEYEEIIKGFMENKKVESVRFEDTL